MGNLHIENVNAWSEIDEQESHFYFNIISHRSLKSRKKREGTKKEDDAYGH